MIKILYWIFSLIISGLILLGISLFGTYTDTEATLLINDQKTSIDLPRYQVGNDGCVITIPSNDTSIDATLYFSPDLKKWFPVDFKKVATAGHVAVVPKGEPNKKYYYYIQSDKEQIQSKYNRSKPIKLVYFSESNLFLKGVFIAGIFISLTFCFVSFFYGYARLVGLDLYLQLSFWCFTGTFIIGFVLHYLYYHALWSLNPFVLNITLDKLIILVILWGVNYRRMKTKEVFPHWVAALLTALILLAPNF